jgi:hypothetical protein
VARETGEANKVVHTPRRSQRGGLGDCSFTFRHDWGARWLDDCGSDGDGDLGDLLTCACWQRTSLVAVPEGIFWSLHIAS